MSFIRDKEYRSEAVRILRLALPIIGTQLLWMSMPLVDNLMVGRLGPESLAALAVASTYYSFLFIVSIGILSAINPMVSQCHGAGHYQEIPRIVHQGIWIALALAALYYALLFAAEPILVLLGQERSVVAWGQKYLNAVALGVPAQVGFFTLRQYCDGVQDPKPTIVFAAIAAAANVFLDYVLVYGHWGFPALGIAGAGLATAICNWFLLAGMGAYVFLAPDYRQYFLFRKPVVDFPKMVEILKLGLPLGGGMISEVGYFSGSTLLVGLIGATEVASHQIALNLISTTFMIPLGLGFAVCARVGYHTGSGQRGQARAAGMLGLAMAALVGIGCAVLLVFARERLVRFYTEDPKVIALATQILLFGGIFQVFDGTQAVGIQALRGLKDTKWPFLCTVIAFWGVGLLLSVSLAFPLGYGTSGIWIGMIASLIVAAVLHQWRFRTLLGPEAH